MTQTTRTTKKSTAATPQKSKQPTAPQADTLPAPTMDPEQTRKDLAAMFAKAAQAARPKAD